LRNKTQSRQSSQTNPIDIRRTFFEPLTISVVPKSIKTNQNGRHNSNSMGLQTDAKTAQNKANLAKKQANQANEGMNILKSVKRNTLKTNETIETSRACGPV